MKDSKTRNRRRLHTRVAKLSAYSVGLAAAFFLGTEANITGKNEQVWQETTTGTIFFPWPIIVLAKRRLAARYTMSSATEVYSAVRSMYREV